MSGRKNKFSKIKRHLKSSEIDEKIGYLNKEMKRAGVISEVMGNTTSSLYNTFEVIPMVPEKPAEYTDVPDTSGVRADGWTQPSNGFDVNDPNTWENAYNDFSWMYNPDDVAGETDRPVLDHIDVDWTGGEAGSGIMVAHTGWGQSLGYLGNDGVYKPLVTAGSTSYNMIPPIKRGSPFDGAHYQYSIPDDKWAQMQSIYAKYEGMGNVATQTIKVWYGWSYFFNGSWENQGVKKETDQGKFLLINATLFKKAGDYMSKPHENEIPSRYEVLTQHSLDDANYYPGNPNGFMNFLKNSLGLGDRGLDWLLDQDEEIAWGKPKGPATTKTRGGANAAAELLNFGGDPSAFIEKYGVTPKEYMQLPQAGYNQSSTWNPNNELGQVASAGDLSGVFAGVENEIKAIDKVATEKEKAEWQAKMDDLDRTIERTDAELKAARDEMKALALDFGLDVASVIGALATGGLSTVPAVVKTIGKKVGKGVLKKLLNKFKTKGQKKADRKDFAQRMRDEVSGKNIKRKTPDIRGTEGEWSHKPQGKSISEGWESPKHTYIDKNQQKRWFKEKDVAPAYPKKAPPKMVNGYHPDLIPKLDTPIPHIKVKKKDLIRAHNLKKDEAQKLIDLVDRLNDYIKRNPEHLAYARERYPKSDPRLATLNYKMDMQLAAADEYVEKHFPENKRLLNKVLKATKQSIKLTDPKTFKSEDGVFTTFNKLERARHFDNEYKPKERKVIKKRRSKSVSRFFYKPKKKTKYDILKDKMAVLDKEIQKTMPDS